MAGRSSGRKTSSNSNKGKTASKPKKRKAKKRKSKKNGFSSINIFKTVLSAAAVFIVCVLCLIGVCIEKGILNKDFFEKNPNFSEWSPYLVKGIEKDENFDFGVYFIDVGQGDSTLIVSGNKTVLIDAGESEYGKVVVKAINSLGIKKLDYVIATHPHSDHIGGLAEVIESFETDKIIAPRVDSDMTPTTRIYENFLDAVRNRGMKITAARAGVIYDLDGAEMEITAPVKDGYNDLNDYSVVCRITKGDIAFLFTGDISKDAEADIISSGADISADVLKVGHHGSKTSSSKDFVDAVSPSLCVISCGVNNDYGHPSDEALKRLKKHTDKIYRTDMNGNMTVFSDGKKLYLKTER